MALTIKIMQKSNNAILYINMERTRARTHARTHPRTHARTHTHTHTHEKETNISGPAGEITESMHVYISNAAYKTTF